MIGYLGSAELKTTVLGHMQAHRAADKLVQGYGYWQDGKGCAVGCTLESVRMASGIGKLSHRDHELYETYLGVPRALARLEDGLFESLPKDVAQLWPERFLSAIEPGADLSMVVPRFLHWLLTDPDGGVQAGVKRRPAIGASVAGVATLYDRWIGGTKPSDTEWREARSAAAADAAAAYAAAAAAAAADAAAADAAAAYAAAAAAAAADAAAYAAAADAAAYAAAYAAAAADAADAAAAYAAADAAAYAAAYAAARYRSRQRQADYLIGLMQSAPLAAVGV